ncbi:MAG: tripartite tricarboxylate transporter TctB family protein [Lachnospiraceae bacterium]|nr:tripartite tricarboxylate transporter TctB family protein [Lachnospiraceae bacterium]
MKLKKSQQDILAGGVLLLFSIGYLALSCSIKLTYIDQIVGSRKFPQICGIIMAFLAILLIAGGIRGNRAVTDEERKQTADAEDMVAQAKKVKDASTEKTSMVGFYKTILVLVSYAIFIWLLDKIGFTIAAGLYLFSQMWLMAGKKSEAKSLIFYALLSAAFAIGIYLLFYKGFSLILPKASWF